MPSAQSFPPRKITTLSTFPSCSVIAVRHAGYCDHSAAPPLDAKISSWASAFCRKKLRKPRTVPPGIAQLNSYPVSRQSGYVPHSPWLNHSPRTSPKISPQFRAAHAFGWSGYSATNSLRYSLLKLSPNTNICPPCATPPHPPQSPSPTHPPKT